MRLLLINFEMDPNSSALAWQLRVAVELANHCEQVVVFTHHLGDGVELPANLRAVVFPRLPQRAPWRWIGGRALLNAFVWRACRKHRIDACFIHMNMEWAYRLYPTFALLRIPVLLWYAHGSVTRRLRLAHRCVTRVVTSTPEGFRIRSSKVRVIGQGIDTSVFNLQESAGDRNDIITVGRISRRKRLELEIKVLEQLRQLMPEAPFRLRFVGAAITPDDHAYARELRELACVLHVGEAVSFVGHTKMADVPPFYSTAFLHLNVSRTGSMDKTVLESLACGCPVLTSNEAFRDAFADRPEWFLGDEDAAGIAVRILANYARRDQVDPSALRARVVGRHDVSAYVDKLVSELTDLVSGSRGTSPRARDAAALRRLM